MNFARTHSDSHFVAAPYVLLAIDDKCQIWTTSSHELYLGVCAYRFDKRDLTAYGAVI